MSPSRPAGPRLAPAGPLGRGLASLAVASTLLAACGPGSGSGPGAAADPVAPAPLEALAAGDPLPAAALPLLATGGEATSGTFEMAQLQGPAVVNFWATWCAFCVEEMPGFEQVHRELDGRVRFVGVDREDNPEAALAFLGDVEVTYDIVEDVDGSYFRAVKGRGMPTTLFVDDDSVIRYRHAGPMTADELRGFIAEHLDVTV